MRPSQLALKKDNRKPFPRRASPPTVAPASSGPGSGPGPAADAVADDDEKGGTVEVDTVLIGKTLDGKYHIEKCSLKAAWPYFTWGATWRLIVT